MTSAASEWLHKACKLQIKLWKYLPDFDPTQQQHIGPMAEDWKKTMGIGNGISIETVDAIGVLLTCIQELHSRIEELEKKVKASDARK